MKKIFLFVVFAILFINHSFGQTAVIECNTAGESCTNPNPETFFITYTTRVIDNGEGWSFQSAQWDALPAAAVVSKSQNGLQFTVKWANTINSPQKKVQVIVTARKTVDGVTSTKDLPLVVQNVTIKHIGAITQLSIGGSGVSFTNLSNGGSVQVACGQQSLSLNVPTPVTDPVSAISYQWQFPWGTQTTSTPSVSTTSNIGETDGNVTVLAKRTDGTFVQTFNFNITRPRVGQPTITAEWPANDNAVCPGAYKQFKMSATNASIFTWSPITTGSLYNPNSQITLTQLTAKTTLTATVNNACNVPQTTSKVVYFGTPTIETATVNGQPQSIPNFIYNPALLNMWTNEVGVSYNWQITNGTGSIYYNGQNQIGVYAYPFVRIDGSISNQCGATSTAFYLYNISGGYYRMSSPNPATNTVTADVIVMGALKKMTLVSNDRPGILRMYNDNGSLNAQTHRNNNLISFDVADLPRGLYYLNFVFEGNKTFTEQIVLN